MNKPEQYFNVINQKKESIISLLNQFQVKSKMRIKIEYPIIILDNRHFKELILYLNVTLNQNIIQNQVIVEIPNLIQDYQFLIQPQITIYYIVQTYEIVCIYESCQNYTNNNTQFLKIAQSSSQENTSNIQLNITDSSKIYLNLSGKVEILSCFELYELTYPFPITELNLEDSQTQEVDIQILYYLILLLILLFVLFICRLIYKNRNIQVQSQNSKNLQLLNI